jgi:hypothetical protein
MRSRLALLATLFVLVGCGADADMPEPPPTQGAGSFVIQNIKWALEGAAKPLWSSLHPGHQRVFKYRRFVTCFRETSKTAAPSLTLSCSMWSKWSRPLSKSPA